MEEEKVCLVKGRGIVWPGEVIELKGCTRGRVKEVKESLELGKKGGID